MARFLPDNRVIRLDHRQPEHTISFATYSKYILSRGTIARGIKLIDQNDESLEKISQHYGVPASVIVALWGVESGYGSSTGHFNMVDAIGTLALEGRRATFFRKELIALLQIIDKEQIPASSLQGSWAGAMGQCQFMPSTYLQYAVDYDHDGRRDIWNNRKDTFASIANYLTAIGWKRGQTWGREVRLKQPVQKSMVGLTTSQNLAAWSKMGIVKLNKSPLPNSPFNASLIQPDGPHGRSFLVYDNFRALMRWKPFDLLCDIDRPFV